jgi:hypothetical protein
MRGKFESGSMSLAKIMAVAGWTAETTSMFKSC